MVKQIIWSGLAQLDRFQILDYWINRNKSVVYSKKLNQIFEDTAEFLSKHPKVGEVDIPVMLTPSPVMLTPIKDDGLQELK